MKEFLKIIRLIKRKKLLGIFIIIKEGLNNLGTFRDVFLGLFINGIYGLFNDPKVFPLVLTIISFLAIIVCNYTIRRKR